MENTSLRGRFSLSTTNLTNPVAESTHLNGSNLHSRFNWGEGTISLQSRNNSLRNNKNTSMSKNLNSTPPKVTMSPVSRIDPRTYVDIHSNGLASRIVRYHDNSAPLNRSLSMGNLYNKPGQFPVVHLKKNETQYKAKKSKNLSMTRIAAPEKSVFQGNTLSSIFRSGSVVRLQKSDEEISRENRPILHPPPTENEMAPTRSVLEVLKEISRKRINSDELDGTELIKKHCKEPDPITYHGQKAQIKRQRESSSTVPSNAQLSPEQQVVKKRMCNYNNDILSSLSSSILGLNKKKLLEIQYQKQNTSDMAANSVQSTHATTYSLPSRGEKQRSMKSFELEHLVAPTTYTPITPLPSTPQQNTSDKVDKDRAGLVTRRASEPVISNNKPKLTLFNKDYDEVPTEANKNMTESKEDGDLCGIQFVKPKKSSSLSTGGTLLMEKTKKSKLALMLSGLKGELNEEDEVDAPRNNEQAKQAEVAAIVAPTVPPIQATLSFETKTTTAVSSVISTSSPTNKSVAAVISTTTPTTVKSPIQFNPPAAVTSASSSPNTGFQIKTPAVMAPAPQTSAAVSVPASITPTSITSTVTSIPTLGGFSFGLNKPLSMPTTAAVTSTPTTTQTIMPISTKAPTLPVAVNAPAPAAEPKAFSFGLGAAQTSTTSALNFTFGSPSKPLLATPIAQTPSLVGAFGNPPATKPAAVAPAPVFGEMTTASQPAAVAPAPVFGEMTTASQPAFSFGSLVTSNSNSSPATTSLATVTSTPPTSTAPSFNFGGFKSSWSPSTMQAQANEIPAPKPGAFSGITTTTSIPQPSTTSTTSSPGGFSFSLPSTQAAKPLFGSVPATTTVSSNEPTKSLFGSMPATSTQANSTPTFSFSTNKTSAPQTNPTNAFTFGSPTPAPAPAPAPPTSNNLPQSAIFGNTAPDKPLNSFSFGAAAPTTGVQLKPAFSFSSTDKPAPPTTTASSSIGGFSFGSPSNSLPGPPDANKNLFGNTAAGAAAPAKPVFSFGSPAASNQTVAKPSLFGTSAVTTPSLFPAATPSQSSPFSFGSSSGAANQQGAPSTEPIRSLFASATSPNQTNGLSTATSSAGSIFGGPSSGVAPLQQSSSFTFGSSSNTASTDTNKPSGGFVFGSNSAIGSNASKPATDLNKTFVFGDGSTTITPAPAGSTNLFGATSTITSGNAAAPENKVFSFGSASAAPAGSNTFGASRQTVNQSPVFSFGGAAPAAASSPAQNGNLFAPQPIGAPSNMTGILEQRPIKKAMRRLHKT